MLIWLLGRGHIGLGYAQNYLRSAGCQSFMGRMEYVSTAELRYMCLPISR